MRVPILLPPRDSKRELWPTTNTMRAVYWPSLGKATRLSAHLLTPSDAPLVALRAPGYRFAPPLIQPKPGRGTDAKT